MTKNLNASSVLLFHAPKKCWKFTPEKNMGVWSFSVTNVVSLIVEKVCLIVTKMGPPIKMIKKTHASIVNLCPVPKLVLLNMKRRNMVEMMRKMSPLTKGEFFVIFYHSDFT